VFFTVFSSRTLATLRLFRPGNTPGLFHETGRRPRQVPLIAPGLRERVAG
jgi:hypothetical protein